MKYLKYFEKHSDYLNVKDSYAEEKMPMLFRCDGIKHIHFKPLKRLKPCNTITYQVLKGEDLEMLPWVGFIPNGVKSFKINNVEYIKKSYNTVNIGDDFIINSFDELNNKNILSNYKNYIIPNAHYKSIEINIPNYNPQTDKIIHLIYLTQAFEGMSFEIYGGETDANYFEQISDTKFKINSQILKEFKDFAYYHQYKPFTHIKHFIMAIEGDYNSMQFKSKPCVVEYEGQERDFVIENEGDIIANIEWGTDIETNDICNFMFNNDTTLKTFNNEAHEEIKLNGDISYMFMGCSKLLNVDISSWNTSNVTNMGYMFGGCSSLTEVRMGGNVSNVSNTDDMFYSITTTGTFYYNSAYDYSKIIAELPSTWTAVPCTLTNGVLIPN